MKKPLKKVYVEITNVCNLDCNFCPKTTREKKFITPKEFAFVLEQIRPYTDHIYLHLMGEPLLHPQLDELLTISEEMGMQVNITTNGTLLYQKKELLLAKKAVRQVNISLHSYEANEQRHPLTVYVQEVLDFAKQCQQKTKIFCSIRLWNMDSEVTIGENQLNHEILSMIEETFPQEVDLKTQILSSHRLKLAPQVYLNMAEKFNWPKLDVEHYSENVFCYALRNQAGILVDGTVVPCCLDSQGIINLGNIYEQSFEQIMYSDRSRAIYEGFSKRVAVEELCKKCHYAHSNFS